METKLARIAQIAKERPKEQFTSLAHLLNVEMLRKCHQELSGNKASGIDEVTKAQYEENLSENLEKLHKSLTWTSQFHKSWDFKMTPSKH